MFVLVASCTPLYPQFVFPPLCVVRQGSPGLYLRLILAGSLTSYYDHQFGVMADLSRTLQVPYHQVSMVSVLQGSVVLTAAVLIPPASFHAKASAAYDLIGGKLGGLGVSAILAGISLDDLDAEERVLKMVACRDPVPQRSTPQPSIPQPSSAHLTHSPTN